MVYVMAVPLLALVVLLNPDTPWGVRQLGGWTIWEYMFLFLFGFLIVGGEVIQSSIRRQRWVSLIMGLVALAIGAALRLQPGESGFGSMAYTLYMGMVVLSAWGLLLAVWGFSVMHLNFGTRGLWLANEAVLPFYIMHQTFIIIIGFFVLSWPIPDVLKYVFIAGGSLLLMFVLHFGLIRRHNLPRVLFGLTPLPKAGRASTPAPA
jgi:hypothetical protein